jgi:hypothetical protein
LLASLNHDGFRGKDMNNARGKKGMHITFGLENLMGRKYW